MSFSAAVSDDIDDFIMSHSPSYESTSNGLCGSYCGVLNCWEIPVHRQHQKAPCRNRTAASSRGDSASSPRSRRYTRQIHSAIVSDDETEDQGEEVDLHSGPTTIIPTASSGGTLPSLPHLSPVTSQDSVETRPIPLTTAAAAAAAATTAAAASPAVKFPLESDPILQARETANDQTQNHLGPTPSWKRVRFCQEATVCEIKNCPPQNTSDMFWSEEESCAFRLERRQLLRSFQQHISYSPLVPWTEDTESM